MNMATSYNPKSVFLGVPCHDQRVHSRFLTSFSVAKSYLDANKITHMHGFAIQAGINVARDMLVSAFMDTGLDTIVMLDCDLEFSLDAFRRLLHCPYMLAGGIYAKKKLDLDQLRKDTRTDGTANEWVARNLKYAWNANPTPTPCGPDGFMPVRSLPTGFLKIRRCVLEEIMRAHPELQYEDDSGKLVYALFLDTMYEDPYKKKRVRFSEDFSFCHKAAACGFQPYADIESTFNHVGVFEYPSNVMSQCSRVVPPGTPPQAIPEAIAPTNGVVHAEVPAGMESLPEPAPARI